MQRFGVICLLVVAGCSAGAEATSGDQGSAADVRDAGGGYDAASAIAVEPADASLPDVRILPAAAYSGVDGQHAYEVPIGVYGAGADVKLTASDATAVTIAPAKLASSAGDRGTYFMVTAKKAGTFTLTASSGGAKATTTLTVAQYSTARWSAGETRYVNGGSGEPACTQCHSPNGGIDHSPAALASANDDDVARVITTGVTPNGAPILSPRHKWTVTDAELAGLVTYLRALPPRGFQ